MQLKQKVKGPLIIYSKNITLKEFNIYACKKCELAINNDYEEIDFAKIKYNNNKNLIVNFNDKLIEEHILTCSKEYLNENVRLLEIGSGSRIGLLSNLQQRIGCEGLAIDPTYDIDLPQDIHEKIKYHRKIEDIPKTNSQNILIARNIIEYMTPEDLSDSLDLIFKEDGLIFLEIQPIWNKNWGSIFTFSEYRTFYSLRALDKLINNKNKQVKWLSSSHIFGEKRTFLSGFISNQKQQKNINYYNNINELCEEIKNIEVDRNIVLWGSGGRSLMFLYNEGKKIVNTIIDSSEERQGIYLPGFDLIKSPSEIQERDKIIILNSRYVDWIQKKVPRSCSFFILASNDS